MAKSLIQKISDAGKSKIAPFVLAGALALGSAGLSGCSTGPQIRTEPVPENPYGNVELTELGKKYGVDMFTCAGKRLKPGILHAKEIPVAKGRKVFYPGEKIYAVVKNIPSTTDIFKLEINGLTTKTNIEGDMKVYSLFGRFDNRDFNMVFDATKLYNLGLKKGFHTTNWEYTIKACRNGKDAPCDPLGSVYFTVTDKK